ncbi:MAG: hypothetical protein WA517_04790 [Candidatus Acidiferrum sp.]
MRLFGHFLRYNLSMAYRGGFDFLRGVGQTAGVHDFISPKYTDSFMATNPHGDVLTIPGAYQVPNRRAAQILEEQARVASGHSQFFPCSAKVLHGISALPGE